MNNRCSKYSIYSILPGLLVASLSFLALAQAESNAQRAPGGNLREIIGVLKHDAEEWKAYVEYVGQTETVIGLEINGKESLKYRELTAIYDEGILAKIKHPIYKNPILITRWEKGVGSKILRIFYPSDSLEPILTLESPDEGMDFEVLADRVRIRYTDPKFPSFNNPSSRPKIITVDWPLDTKSK